MKLNPAPEIKQIFSYCGAPTPWKISSNGDNQLRRPTPAIQRRFKRMGVPPRWKKMGEALSNSTKMTDTAA
ncbi:Uncharacterized protein TCM_015713 [Theobroma cacao]|uniref:Uncharacterized protein n=1 Tax=Theobroma cacao TaxID=3641 RepID=A0A061G3K3_THECC|nr:Uncharacterized protein TCM_015713 [Theobroma cacao]